MKKGLASQAFTIKSTETEAPRYLYLFHVVACCANGYRHDEKPVKENMTLIDVEPVPVCFATYGCCIRIWTIRSRLCQC